MHPLIEEFHQRVKQDPKRIVLPEAEDPRMLEAAAIAVRDGLARPVLLGAPAEIQARANACGVVLDGVEIVDFRASEQFDEFAAEYAELRAKKGKPMNPRAAAKMLSNPLFFGAMMVRKGLVHGAVAGAVNTTGNVVISALYLVGLREGCQTLSSAFVMIHPDPRFGEQGMLLYADSAVIPDPTLEQVVDITISTAETARNLFGVEPRIAMITFSTKGSASHPSVQKMVDATKILQEKHPELCVDGELQIDSALIPEIGASKAPGSPVAGRANVLIFPDLNTGNTAYKITERLGGAKAYGPLLQGVQAPMSDLSRGCSVDDIINTMIMTSLQTRA